MKVEFKSWNKKINIPGKTKQLKWVFINKDSRRGYSWRNIASKLPRPLFLDRLSAVSILSLGIYLCPTQFLPHSLFQFYPNHWLHIATILIFDCLFFPRLSFCSLLPNHAYDICAFWYLNYILVSPTFVLIPSNFYKSLSFPHYFSLNSSSTYHNIIDISAAYIF